MSSTANYIAWRERRDLDDGARTKIQAAAAATEKPANTIQTQTIGKKVADLTGNKQAPDDLVADNRQLFDEVIDNAKLDEIRTSAPKLFEYLSNPGNAPIAKDDYGPLVSIEQTASRIGTASKAIPDGTLWHGGWQNSPSIPDSMANGDVADEFVAVRQQQRADPSAGSSVWDNPGEAPEAVQDGTAWQGGWVDSPSVPYTGAKERGDLAADAATIRQQANQPQANSTQNTPASGTSPGQSGGNGLRPGEIVIPVEVQSEPSSPDSAARGAGTTTPGSAQGVSSSATSEGPASPDEGSTGQSGSDGLRPGERVIDIEVVPEPHGSDSATETALPADQAPGGAGRALAAAPPAVRNNSSVNTAEAPNTSNNRSGFSPSYGDLPPTQENGEGWSASYNKGDAGRDEVVREILGAKELTGKQFGVLRRKLKHQPFIDSTWAIHVADAVRYSNPSKEWLHEALLPHTLDREGKEVVRAVPGAALNSVGHATEAVGQLLHTTESEARTALVEDIANARGKSTEEIAALRRRIADQHDINPTDAQRFLSEVLAGDMGPDEARQAQSPMLKEASETLKNAGAGIQDYSKTVLPAPPDMEHSWGRGLGEAIGGAIPVIATAVAAGPLAAWLYGALDTAGTLSSEARDSRADPAIQAKAAWLGLQLGLVANAPVADKVTKLPWLRNYADSWVDSFVLKPLVGGALGAGQKFGSNVIAQRTYDPMRDWWDGVAFSFATGTVVSGVEPGLKRAARLAITPVQRAVELHGMLNEMGDRLKAVPPLADGSKIARAIIEQRLEGTPVENVYFRADTFVDSLRNAGIDPWRFTLSLKGTTLADLKAAVEAKGYIRIPTATFAVDLMGTKAGRVLRPNLSFEPGGMTAVDAQAFGPIGSGAKGGLFGGKAANTLDMPFGN